LNETLGASAISAVCSPDVHPGKPPYASVVDTEAHFRISPAQIGASMIAKIALAAAIVVSFIVPASAEMMDHHYHHRMSYHRDYHRHHSVLAHVVRHVERHL
jgi:hypothetical protein